MLFKFFSLIDDFLKEPIKIASYSFSWMKYDSLMEKNRTIPFQNVAC
jgi:hypothetical protein